MDFPHRQERRDIRYPVHLPVLLRLAHQAIHTRSENISVGGIFVSSALLIHEGSTVEVEASLPSPGVQLSARGKVLRVLPQASGNFAVAIAFERPLELGRRGLDPGCEGKGTSTPSTEE
jgi:hypothetical protein